MGLAGDRGATDITDVDVLGIQPVASLPGREFSRPQDGQKMSAINRALWAGGLRSMINADEGFVILAEIGSHGHCPPATR